PGQRGLPRRRRRLPPCRHRRPGTRTGPGGAQLRLVRLVQRPRRQRLAAAADHPAPAGTLRSGPVEYLVTMTTHVPGGTPPETVDDVRAREAARTRDLAAR